MSTTHKHVQNDLARLINTTASVDVLFGRDGQKGEKKKQGPIVSIRAGMI